MKQLQGTIDSQIVFHESKYDLNRGLKLGKLLTTGSRIASVKLSGGDIFKIWESAFLLKLKLTACSGACRRSTYTLKECVTAQNAAYFLKVGGKTARNLETHIIDNSRACIELSAAWFLVSRLRLQPTRRDKGVSVGRFRCTYLLLVPKLQAT